MRFKRNSLDTAHPAGQPSGWRARLTWPSGSTAAAGLAVALALTLVGVLVAGTFSSSGARSGSTTATPASRAANPTSLAGTAAATPGSGPAGPTSRAARTAARGRPAALRTSCRSVAHIGDSTSADLISPVDLPDPAQRLQARYYDVGAHHVRIDASGGRSIVEVLPGQVNGYNAARGWQSQGYRGCWVFALGTNDTANVAVGSSVGLMARIQQMMSVAHGQPVLWVNTRTMLSAGPWAEANEQAWDNTLVRALRLYPNMRIFNWAALAQPGWFLPDGIHYNSAGCAHRAEAIAHALARAFPQRGNSRDRIVL